jgi:hypothetical protein
VAAGFALAGGLTLAGLSLVWPNTPVHVHVRWTPDVTDAERVTLERRFRLIAGQRGEGSTWEYQLTDPSTGNIRSIVQHERVDDTAHLNRIRYRPEFAQDRVRQILAYSVTAGGLGSALGLVVALRRRAVSVTAGVAALRAFVHLGPVAPVEQPSLRNEASVRGSPGATAAVAVSGVTIAVAISWFAGAAFLAVTAALAVVYVCGYVTGSLLVNRIDSLSWTVIRIVTGLLATALAFLLSLRLSLPWFAVPAGLAAAAVHLHGWAALTWPRMRVRFSRDDAAAAMLAMVLLSPIGLTYVYMAPGAFPPVFYNVDTPAVLEKVHALVAAETYPPESLSNVGARRTYHYATQAMAALTSRASGLLPHHSLFLVVLPLLTVGVAAAAFAAARVLGGALPRCVAVPLLLVSIPSLSRTFWGNVGPDMRSAAASFDFSIDRIVGEFGRWGFLSNEAKNVGGDFVILAGIAAIGAAPAIGWRLAIFLIGTAVAVKAPVGVALVAGFLLAEAWRAAAARRLRPSPQMVLVAALAGATVAVFFLGSSSDGGFSLEWMPFYHLRGIVQGGNTAGLVADLLWLLAPALIVLAATRDGNARSAVFLVMAIAPVLVVNATRLDSTGGSGGGAGDDWLQVLQAVPFLLHAFALSVAGSAWTRLGAAWRASVLAAMVLATAPVTVAAARYSQGLIEHPQDGHEFVDNRLLAEALAAIPTDGTVVVTNDLRYPAQNFTRDERQMQIPALFGHQAFAANYAYEVVPFAKERRELQKLLQQPHWSDAIQVAARTHHWTHLLIRKDYPHPAPLPVERLFENEFYAVFRFP